MKTRSQKKARSTAGKKIGARIGISLLGIMFIFWGLITVALGIVGEKGVAVITHIRREGGERNEAIRGRYTYCIAYRFSLPDGRRIEGWTKQIGDSVFLKATGKSIRPVRYFAAFPHINALEKDTQSYWGQAVIVGIGAFLIWVMNSKRTRKK